MSTLNPVHLPIYTIPLTLLPFRVKMMKTPLEKGGDSPEKKDQLLRRILLESPG